MKKLLAVLVVFALVTGAVFAEISFGASVQGGISIIGSDGVYGSAIDDNGNAVKTDPNIVNGWQDWGRMGQGDLSVSGQNEDGTFGGKFNVFSRLGYAFWQPLSQLKLTIGNGKWGVWGGHGKDAIVGWGFTEGAQDFVSINNYGVGKWSDSIGTGTGFTGGFSTGLMIELFPVDGFTFVLGIPYPDGDVTPQKIEDSFLKLYAQAAYKVDGIGEFALSYQSNKGYKKGTNFDYQGYINASGQAAIAQDEWDVKAGSLIGIGLTTAEIEAIIGKRPEDPELDDYYDGYNADTGKFFLSFNMSAIENLGLNFGVAYQIPKTIEETTKNYPVELGLGVSYGMGEFNVKARFATKFGGGTKTSAGTSADGIVLGFSILPSYDLGILKAFFNAGIAFSGKGKDAAGNETGKEQFGWYINPYISKSIGGGTLYFGFKCGSDGAEGSAKNGTSKDSAVEWSIPIGFNYSF